MVGPGYLSMAVNALARLLAVLTLTSYLFLYTPLKRKTPLCTLVGAAPGAMPPLIGWPAASGSLSSKAWILYAVLFLWQFPHFMSIAWMYREDYAGAGYLVLPKNGGAERFKAWLTLAPSLVLLMVSLTAVATGSESIFRYPATFILGSGFFYYCARLALLP